MARTLRFVIFFIVAVILLRLLLVGAIPAMIIRSGIDKYGTIFSSYLSVVGEVYIVAVFLTGIALVMRLLRGSKKKRVE